MIFKRITITASLIFMCSHLFSQALFYNNGAQMYMNPGSLMIVKTNSIDNNIGIIDNAGELIVEGDFINSDIATGNGLNSGVYDIEGNWVNNNNFTADASTVILSGGNQLITGTQSTTFYNLDLEGSGIKTQTINAQVNGTLYLRDAELATDLYDMWVANNNINAIERNTGFVSSIDTGKLLRSTNNIDSYIFPTGSSVGTLRYRPIIIAPNTTNNDIYGARLANVDATAESFDRNIKEDELCIINPNFYHRLYQTTGNDAANITMLYDALQDGSYATMAHWQNISQWEDMNGSATNISGFNAVQVNNWTDFSSSPFALANAKSFVTAFSDTTILIEQSASLFTTISNNVNNYSWFPNVALSCNDCPNPVVSPQQTTLYVVTINEGNECAHSDSVLVKVQADLNVWIPNAFTPNGDGQNETLKVFGNLSYLKSIDFKIFNRWGEKVFEALDIATATQGWDGTYFGKLQDSGVFTYTIRAFYVADIAPRVTEKGSITLIR